MSTHLVHILKHNSYLSIDRGCLVCKYEDEERRLPLADILAVIIAARGVGFSGEALSSIINNGAVILHCDHSYKPIGKTIGLSNIVHVGTFESQLTFNPKMADNIWQKIITAKIANQAHLLDYLKVEHKLWDYLKTGNNDEGNAARHYWGFYFKQFGRKNPKTRERRGATDPVNSMLNYGYAVIGALLHRSLLAHGLNTSIGVHHKLHFKSDPLLYDAIEPVRPICDFLLLKYRQDNPSDKIEDWVKTAAKNIMFCKIKTIDNKRIKLVNAIDFYASSLANVYRFGNIKSLFIPSILGAYFEGD
ncbi:MAG: type II CRISPR-associated endonuclease Cas1 [Elusimicrobiota bacterium]|jgi:CRISPR-associated protein Cas1|nr:type II CRISPR-associated endonuclease Cas1 [Elusimicrobiota bacterium]